MVKNQPKIIVIIPARGGSKSIPRKNIKLLGGYPLIAYSIAAGLKAKLVDRVLVSTDDAEIAEVAKKIGADVPFMRPAELAGDNVTDFPVFEHVLRWLRENENESPDIVIQLRPTSPFRPIECVDEAVQLLMDHPQADSVRGVTPSGQNPYKMWRIESPFMRPILPSEFAEPYNMPRQELPKTFWQTGHIDAIRCPVITEKQSLSGENILPYIIEPQYAVDLDTPVQWEFAEYLMRNGDLQIVQPDGICHTALADIRLIVSDFDGVMTDDLVSVGQDGSESVVCSREDGMGIALLRSHQIPFVVLSTEENPVVSSRCQKLKLSCYQGVHDKASAIDKVAAEYNIRPNQMAYVGNDINDLEAMKKTGLSVAVANAHPEVLREAKWVLSKTGGKGAIRELCEKLIINQKRSS
jgi:YrbI family 3-deoxy-D-manno-octulosonate 8-phosphate phosphatase